MEQVVTKCKSETESISRNFPGEAWYAVSSKTELADSDEPKAVKSRAMACPNRENLAGTKGSSPRREKPITFEYCNKRDEASGSKLNAIWRKGQDALGGQKAKGLRV